MTKAGRAGVRLRQAAVVTAGVVVALVMMTLGLWQMQRSLTTGEQSILDRASQPPVPLLEHVRPDNTFDDIYGKQVTVTGRYVAGEQVLVVGEDGTIRVLAALQVADGRVVPVVRGVASARTAVPPEPAGERTETGLFLPGEGDVTTPAQAGELASVRMPLLAQLWPQRLTPGFVTLTADGSAVQGLGQAGVTLPKGEKSLQNGSYAIQWWIFAAVAVGIGVMAARSMGERARRAEDAAALASPGSVGDVSLRSKSTREDS